MVYDTALAREALSLAEKWDASRSEADVSKLDFHESDLASFNANQKSAYTTLGFPTRYPLRARY